MCCLLKAVQIFDLDPRAIEQPSDDRASLLRRDGYGVGAYLGKLQEDNPGRFAVKDRRLVAKDRRLVAKDRRLVA